MRDIRFRAAYQGRVFGVSEIMWSEQTVFIHNLVGSADELIPMADVTLLQFTGLHDKNGKEIYEGDIVQRTMHYADDHGEQVGDAEVQTSVVKWEEAQGVQMVGFSFFPCDDIHQLEVIGNIYENPDLMKA